MMFPTILSRALRSAPALASLAGLALAPSPSRAGLVIEVMNAKASGGSGSFDIVLADTGGTYQVSAFSVEPIIIGSGALFTSATTNTTAAPYLFGTYQSSPSPFASDPNDPGSPAAFPLTDFVASDADFTGPDYYVTLSTGALYGLAHVSYSILGGPANVSFGPYGTSLSDVNGGAIPFTTMNGSLPATVPEPSSLLLLATGAAARLASRRKISKAIARLRSRHRDGFPGLLGI